MKTARYIGICLLAAVLGSWKASADEGMWLIHTINAALEKKMQERGLELSAGEIYNADAPGAGVADAIVSMEFGCTGSMISENGLLITNHHCAYGDVHALSTPEHNYLEEGFWAMRSDEEINIKDKSVWFLKKVIDVTEEVEELKRQHEAEGKVLGSRKLSYVMERKYAKDTDLEPWFASMWSGSKYYIALYKVYKDVRLVAAPPVSSAAFGGDIDNWEWPQHKCDFAMYRVYTAPDGSPAEYSKENVPYRPERILPISLDGYKEGDYTMILGYPGRTNRYSTSFETRFNETLKLPISNGLRGKQMDIINGWMNQDPDIRLKYSDYFFSLSNVQELYSGEVLCYGRFNVADRKAELEKELQEWIDASPERKSRWGDLLPRLEKAYTDVRDAERNIGYYRETLIRGTRLTRIIGKTRQYRDQVLKINKIKPTKKAEMVNGALTPTKGPSEAEVKCFNTFLFKGKDIPSVTEGLLKEYQNIDLRVEKDLFRFCVESFLENVDSDMIGAFHKELLDRYGRDYDAIAGYLWDNSFLTDMTRLNTFLDTEHTVSEYLADPFFRFFDDVEILTFNNRIQEAEGENDRTELDREFVHAIYQMREDKGIPQYPDANSTMRITYGTVRPVEPYDGVFCDWKSTAKGMIEKYDPASYEFNLSDRQYLLYKQGDWGRWGCGPDGKTMYVNFLTDNDITGGNSGSPVLNSKGELIGLAFDGNKESLANDMMCVDGYNMCVCVDIRYILWTLDRYAGMTRIIEELGL
ncbi:MAG: S46 family peptidase [Bacteroidales bacterium]|nr:S46 family peptidase [Bacteroidales bacterium]